MKIVWDETKRLANIAKHGLDFADLDVTFFDAALVQPTHKDRYQAIGPNVHGVISVVFATLGKEASASSACALRARTKGSFMSKSSRKGKSFTAKDLKEVSNNPRWTKRSFAEAKPFGEMFPHLAESIKRGRGRPKLEAPKEAIKLRLDADVLAAYRATGDGWQTKINSDLRRARKLRVG